MSDKPEVNLEASGGRSGGTNASVNLEPSADRGDPPTVPDKSEEKLSDQFIEGAE